MSLIANSGHLLHKTLLFPPNNCKNSGNNLKNFNSDGSLFLTASLSCKTVSRSHSLHFRINSLPPNPSIWNRPTRRNLPIQELVLLFAFCLILLVLRLCFNALLPNFAHRWHNLVVFSRKNKLRTSDYPSHWWQAIVAYEDKRFFSHNGMDPVGISRAILSFSARCGGSTIAQQVNCLMNLLCAPIV